MWWGTANIGYCTLCLAADWFLCYAAAESTKYIIGLLSAQAQEITNGYLMNCLDSNASLELVHICGSRKRMERVNPVDQKYICFILSQSIQLDHWVLNATSCGEVLCKSKVSFLTIDEEINVIVLSRCRNTKMSLLICCGILDLCEINAAWI